jgi:hypothetical protein
MAALIPTLGQFAVRLPGVLKVTADTPTYRALALTSVSDSSHPGSTGSHM